MDIYSLSRTFWDYAFENPEKIKPNHCALFFFAVEHCNRLGWKEKFGLPTTMVMEALGIKSYHTYIKTFNDLIDFGFFILHEKSKNQYSSNVIALAKNAKANAKALDKALSKHDAKHISKHSQSTVQSIDSINIQYTNIPLYNSTNDEIENEVFKRISSDKRWIEALCITHKSDPDIMIDHLRKFYYHCKAYDYFKGKDQDAKIHFNNWIKKGNYPPAKIKDSLSDNPE
jgi:uncharacterized protein (UPF0333 family)